MPFPNHRWAALALYILPALAHSAIIEIHEPVGHAQLTRERDAAQIRLPQAWQSTGDAHAPWPASAAIHASPAAQVLRVANPAGVTGLADGDPVTAVRPEIRGIVRTGLPADSDQMPELWTLVVLGAGLVAYQLRRQLRNRSGMIRFPH